MQRLLLILPRSRYGRMDAPYLRDKLTLGHKYPKSGIAGEAEGLELEVHQNFIEEHSTNMDFWAILKGAALSGLCKAADWPYEPEYSPDQEMFYLLNFQQLRPICESCKNAGVELGSIIFQGVAAN